MDLLLILNIVEKFINTLFVKKNWPRILETASNNLVLLEDFKLFEENIPILICLLQRLLKGEHYAEITKNIPMIVKIQKLLYIQKFLKYIILWSYFHYS